MSHLMRRRRWEARCSWRKGREGPCSASPESQPPRRKNSRRRGCASGGGPGRSPAEAPSRTLQPACPGRPVRTSTSPRTPGSADGRWRCSRVGPARGTQGWPARPVAVRTPVACSRGSVSSLRHGLGGRLPRGRDGCAAPVAAKARGSVRRGPRRWRRRPAAARRGSTAGRAGRPVRRSPDPPPPGTSRHSCPRRCSQHDRGDRAAHQRRACRISPQSPAPHRGGGW